MSAKKINPLDYATQVLHRLGALNLTPKQGLLLSALAKAGKDGITIADLAAASNMAECSISQTLSGLYEPNGFSTNQKRHMKLSLRGTQLAHQLFTWKGGN